MYRLIKLTGKWYGYEFNDLEYEADNLGEFINCGDVVVLCSELEDATKILGIDVEDITLAK